MKKPFKNAMIGAGGAAVFASLALGAMAAQSAWRVYNANDPVGRNVVAILSQAPLETMLTRTNAVTGTVQFDPKNVLNAPKASFVVDAASLDTGIAMRNEHMKSAAWLDTAKYPKISFTLTRVLAPSGAMKLPVDKAVRGIVEGKLYFHGRTRLVKANLEVTAMPQSAGTKERLPGDLLHVRATFPLSLKEFGVAVPAMAQAKIADQQQVMVDIFSSTDSPAPGSAPADAAQ